MPSPDERTHWIPQPYPDSHCEWEWDTVTGAFITFAYNFSHYKTPGFSTFYLLFGHDPTLPTDIWSIIMQTHPPSMQDVAHANIASQVAHDHTSGCHVKNAVMATNITKCTLLQGHWPCCCIHVCSMRQTTAVVLTPTKSYKKSLMWLWDCSSKCQVTKWHNRKWYSPSSWINLCHSRLETWSQ